MISDQARAKSPSCSISLRSRIEGGGAAAAEKPQDAPDGQARRFLNGATGFFLQLLPRQLDFRLFGVGTV
jgi:hypothetical protein